MSTENLIRALSADAAAPRRTRLELRVTAALGAGLIAVAGVVAWRYGVRGDLAGAAVSAAGALKFAGGALLAAAGARLACRLSRPDAARPAFCPVSVAALTALAAVAVGGALLGGPATFRAPTFDMACAGAILSLSAIPLVAALIALRAGAPTRPAAAGAAAGLAAGGAAAIGYALWCPANGFGYVAASYGGAVLLAGAAGAVAGRRLLAW